MCVSVEQMFISLMSSVLFTSHNSWHLKVKGSQQGMSGTPDT